MKFRTAIILSIIVLIASGFYILFFQDGTIMNTAAERVVDMAYNGIVDYSTGEHR